MRCPSFWSRPLSGYLLGLTDALLDQVDAVSGRTTRCLLYKASTQDGACSSITDGDDHDAEWSEEDGNQRTSGHQTRTSPTQPVP
ncbi:hypothetical protein NXS19_003942 [Fusarium pseudograminearum]|nr:hypothetical protein NXS19_003942 [Fusarium pseudograminearum]